MRVLTVTPFFPPDYTGGAEVSIYHTNRGLLEQGVRSSILSINTRQPESADEWYELDRLHVHRVRLATRLPGSTIFDPRIFRVVQQEIQTLQPDIMHIHNAYGASLAPYAAARRAGVPVVNTLHDHWLLCPNNMLLRDDLTVCEPAAFPNGCNHCYRKHEYWGNVPRRRQLFARLTANALFTPPSQALIDLHVQAGYDPARFRLVRLGFPEQPLQAATHRGVRRLQSVHDGRPMIVFSGGSVDIKGGLVVLDAVPVILAALPDARIVIAGTVSPEVSSAYRAYAPAVEVLGRLPFNDMRTLFALADLTLVPSIWYENSPVTIFESHQVGTPVVGSAIGGIPELITHGQTGYLVPPGDAPALARTIVEHLGLPGPTRRRMRRASVESVRTYGSLARHMAVLRSVYDEVIQQATPT